MCVNRSRACPGTREPYLGNVGNVRWVLTLLALLLLASACRKDKDTDPPQIRFILPANGSTVAVPDTLLVQVEVSDERSVKSVTIGLEDGNGVPVSPPQTVQVNSVSAVVTRELALTNERLPTGTYTLSAMASDGENQARTFRTISLQAAPLRLRALFLAPPIGSGGALAITKIDSVGNLSQYLTISESGGAAIDPDRLYIAGTITQALVGLPQVEGLTGITVPNLNPAGSTIPFFRGVTVDPADARLYFGTNDGFIRGLGQNGAQTFTAQSPTGFRSIHSAVMGDVLVSFARNEAAAELRLITHAYSSGVVLGQFTADLDPVFLMPRNNAQLLVFGNRNGTGLIQERNVVQGGGFDLREFSEGPISAVARLDANTAIVAIPDRLIRYSANSNTVVLLAQGFTAQALAYEPATGSLHVGVGNMLFTVDPLTGAQSSSTMIPHDIGTILPLLNR